MRCKNCGWVNPDGAAKCEKCNTTLPTVPSETQGQNIGKGRMEATSGFDATVVDNIPPIPDEARQDCFICSRCQYEVSPLMDCCPVCGTSVNDRNPQPAPTSMHLKKEPPATTSNCPRCGYPVVPNARFCVQCGTPLAIAAQPPNPIAHCSFQPLSWFAGTNGEPVISIDMMKSTLTLVAGTLVTEQKDVPPQAQLSYEDGEWFIEDKSHNHTTMMPIKNKVQLRPGDVVAIGNRLFEFKG